MQHVGQQELAACGQAAGEQGTGSNGRSEADSMAAGSRIQAAYSSGQAAQDQVTYSRAAGDRQQRRKEVAQKQET